MRVIKLALFSFLLTCAVFSGTTSGVIVEPSVVTMPASSGDLFSFDLVISQDPAVSAQSFQATVAGISGPGLLTFDVGASEAVATQPLYWVYQNSAGVTAIDKGDGSYTFGDGPEDGLAQALAAGDIMARYAFTWDGTEGDYTFTFNFDTASSFVQLEDFTKQALQLPTGEWYTYPIVAADSSSFTVNIPEPATLVLFTVGGLVLLRRRARNS